MLQYPANGRIISFVLALVLVALSRPAEGLTFFEQREPFAGPFPPELRSDPTQVIIDLSGPWECMEKNGHPFQVWLPGSYWGESGELTLRRTFGLPDTLRPWHFQVQVPEANYAVQVWVNGRMISSFAGGHLGFSCDVSRDILRFGQTNELVLKLSSKLSPSESLPLAPQAGDVRNYGGIFSGIYLRGVPAWSIEDATLNSRKNSQGQLAAEVQVRIARYAPNPLSGDSSSTSRPIQLVAAIRDSLGNILAQARKDLTGSTTGAEFQATVSLPATAVAWWSPHAPVRYELTTALVAGADTLHRRTETVGFKQVEIQGADIYLNGERLRLQGMDYIPEHLRGGRAMATYNLRSDLEAMKDLGVNLIRVPCGPPPVVLASLADEMGLLIMVEPGLSEVPTSFLTSAKHRQLCEHAYTELVSEFKKHVSVFGWGIGSKLDWKNPAVQELNEWLYATVKGLDGRPCYTETYEAAEAGRADIVLLAAQPSVNNDSVALPVQMSRPVLIAGLGKLVCPGDPDQRDMSEGLLNQANYLIREIGRVNAAGELDGYIIHAFADYHGESPLVAQPNHADPFLYGYGMVGFNRSERVVYFKLRDLVQTGLASPPVSSPMAHGSPIAFPAVGLAALLVVSIEMRRNNVFRQNLKRVFMHPHGFHMDLRYRRFLHTVQPLLLWMLESLTLALVLASLLYAFRNSLALDYYLTLFLRSPNLKASLINLIWHPESAVLFFSLGFLALILTMTVLIRIVSIPFRERMDFWQATNYVVWSLAALLFLLPVSVILFRTLETPSLLNPSLTVIVLGLLWCVQRMLSALRIGYGTTTWRIYLTVFVVLGLAVAGVVMMLDHNFGTLAYLDYFDRVLRGL
jgi:hypothetical protein